MKPVAWSCWNEGMPCAVILVTEPNMYEWQSIKPLYTAAPSAVDSAPRELSDEEIRQIYIETMESPYTHQQSYFGFARAILKKASEK
jgi:hypothetical protein